MNLPNKLTILRIILVPFFVAILLGQPFGGASDWVALGIFVVASLTDLLDGQIARRCNMITDFGKFMDPLADKILTCSGMICLTALGRMPAWVVCIIVAREFAISGFRLVAAEKGTVIAASWWGKFKTVFQMAMILLMLANMEALQPLTDIVMWIATILTVVSLVDYIWKNRGVLSDIR